MRTINTTFKTFGASVLLLGLKGDSNATEILIDCAESLEEYQGTMAAMSITGPDDTVYPGDISLDENGIVHWVVAARDCGIAGNGSARVDLVDDQGTVVASAEARTIIMKTNMQGVAPDQIANWTEAASVALQEARAALLDLIDLDTTATTNEAARQLAETGRVSAETLRASAETARASAETARATAENTRASAESTRIAAENTRASAESTRIAAEAARVSEFSTIEANAQAALSYIGPSEASSTASATHEAGSYFIYDGNLYQATADIFIGDTITSGTNCAQVPGGSMGEVCNLKSAISDAEGNIIPSEALKIKIGYTEETIQQTIGASRVNSYWNIEATTAVRTELPSNWETYDPFDVVEGERYKVKACQGNTHKTRIWVITDDNLNVISMAKNHFGINYATEDFFVPNGGTKLLITTTSSVGGSSPYAYLTKIVMSSDVEKSITRNDFTFEQNSGWLIDTGYAIKTVLSGSYWCASSEIPVKAGQKFTATGVQGNSHKVRVWALVDDNMQVVAQANDAYGYTAQTTSFVVPETATKLLLTGRNDSGYVVLIQNDVDAYEYAEQFFEKRKKKILLGKKLSLLGDSISAYAGTIPSGNAAYYTGSNSGVTSPDQMWWKILCDKTGMIPLIINGWSGSGINWQTDSSHANIVPMSDDSRCNGLHDGSTTPDIILIAGGVNDYTYAQYAQNEPLAWDGKTTPGYTEPTTGKKVYNSFTEAYVAMIKKLQTNYPNAIVVALSTWFTMRGTDNGYILTHTVGQNVYTQQNYNDKIRYVAEQMHIPYIDVSNIGFNRNNFYPTYAVDSSTIPTHPNAAGQAVMGKAIAEKIVELVRGYLT